MIDKHFRVNFDYGWHKYSMALRKTASEVIEAFKESELEDNFSKWYFLSMPGEGESPIHFVLRNTLKSYATDSLASKSELMVLCSLGWLGWYSGKVPFLRQIIRSDSFSTELYLGQKNNVHAYKDESVKGEGFGNDRIRHSISSFSRSMNLDIDFGFENNEKRNWFYQINVFSEDLLSQAERVYNIMEKAR
ncbi:MAG: hypothetical protein AABW50_05425 [Nanoarchaeota archaeon]